MPGSLPKHRRLLQITYSSDHFEQLYQLSIQLIKGGHAYVDHQTADQIKLSRFDPLGRNRKCLKDHLANMPSCLGRLNLFFLPSSRSQYKQLINFCPSLRYFCCSSAKLDSVCKQV